MQLTVKICLISTDKYLSDTSALLSNFGRYFTSILVHKLLILFRNVFKTLGEICIMKSDSTLHYLSPLPVVSF